MLVLGKSVGSFQFSHSGVDDGPKESIYHEFMLNCPNITTLALKGFILDDYIARMLMKVLFWNCLWACFLLNNFRPYAGLVRN